MKLPREWSEFIDLLLRHRVKFLLIGAHALAVHGHPRATLDLDVFVEPTLANARRIGAALAEFGFEASSREWRHFAEPDRMMTLGREPLRIDVLNRISGVTFATAWKHRTVGVLHGRRIYVIGLRELRRNKRASGRAKDLLDLALLDEGRKAHVTGYGGATRPRSRRADRRRSTSRR